MSVRRLDHSLYELEEQQDSLERCMPYIRAHPEEFFFEREVKDPGTP